jgi:hypothetical protein
MPATPALLEDVTGVVTRDASFANAEMWLSTHSANPGSSGADELTTGTGDEGRQQVTYNSGGSGSDSSNIEASVVIPGAQTIPWVGFWTAQTGGTFLGGYPLVGPNLTAVAISGGSTVYCPGHGLTANQPVRLFDLPNGSSVIPTGLGGDPSIYYVKTVLSADEFTLAGTLGGSAITVTSSGAFFVCADATEVFTSGGGLLVFAIGNVVYATVS